jgi:hypothetical protein
MGMYTEFYLKVRLTDKIPEDMLTILNYMIELGDYGVQGQIQGLNLKHSLFSTERWPVMLRSASNIFNRSTTLTGHGLEYQLTVRANFKNYDDEISKFIDWINPYIINEPGTLLGFTIYEEHEDPTFIYKE